MIRPHVAQDLHQRQTSAQGRGRGQRLRPRPALWRRRVRGPAQLRRQGVPPGGARRAAVRVGPGDLARDPDVAARRWPTAINETRRAPTTSTTATSALVVTRGAGTLGLDPNRCSNPQVIIIADAITLYPNEFYENGLEIDHRQRHPQPPGRAQPADQVAQLSQQHPRQDRRPAGRLRRSADAQPQGRSRRVHGRQHLPGEAAAGCYTPPLDAGILEGVTRNAVIELARDAGHRRRTKPRSPSTTSTSPTNASSPAPPPKSSPW